MDADQIVRERASVVGSALGWLGTPYHHMGERKGVGADCITFLRGAVLDARIGIDSIPMEYYPIDWHMHRDAERYIGALIDYCVEMPPIVERAPLAADFVLFKMGRTFSHGALVLDFPKMIHSVSGEGVVRADFFTTPKMQIVGERGADFGKPRPTRVFSLKRWVE